MLSIPLTIYTTLASFEPDDGKVYPVDTIWYARKRWLVPAWIEHSSGEWQYPTRIIFPKNGRFLLSRSNADFVLTESRIPRSVFDGHTKPSSRDLFLVIEHPDMRLYYEVGQMAQKVLKGLQTESHRFSLNKLTG